MTCDLRFVPAGLDILTAIYFGKARDKYFFNSDELDVSCKEFWMGLCPEEHVYICSIGDRDGGRASIWRSVQIPHQFSLHNQ